MSDSSLSSILAPPSAPVPSTMPAVSKALPKPISDDGTLLTQLVQWWEESEWVSREAREASQRDRDYYDNIQWTAAEIEQLRKRGQPTLTINRVVRKVNYLKGFEMRLRSDPKAFPRNPGEEAEADVATKALRYCCDDNNHDQVRSLVFENMIIEGYGGSELIAEPGQDGIDVREHHVPWDRIWFDPHSAKQDFSDARYMGTVIWMDRDQAIDQYPGAADVIQDMVSGWDGSYDDRPGHISWVDSRRQRVRIVQCHWKQRGDWWTATFTRTGFVEQALASPYIDRRGNTCSPLRLRSAYVDRQNRRYGEVRQYISMQDELNKRRSKALHIMNTRQVIATRGAVADETVARREIAKPDGWVVLNDNPGRFDIRDNQDMASGQMQLMAQVSAEIDATGPNAAMAGKDPREQSGRAIQAQQQGGAVEQEPLIDGLRQWDRGIYEAMWMRIRQFWTGPRWIAVTDDPKNVKWVGLNRPVTLQDELAQMPDAQRAMAMQRLQLQPNDPRLAQVIRTENDISSLDVRITVEEGPDISTVQAQTFTDLGQMVSSGVQIPPLAIIEASPLPQDMKDRITALMQQAQQVAAAQAQQAAQQAHELQMAKLGLTSAQTQLATATANDRNAAAVERVHGMRVDHAAAAASPHTIGGALDPTDVIGQPAPTLGGAPTGPAPVPQPMGQPLQ